MNAIQDNFNPNPRMVELWRMLIDMERTWRGFSPLPDLNKSLFGVMMCVAHGGKPGEVPAVFKAANNAACRPGAQKNAAAASARKSAAAPSELDNVACRHSTEEAAAQPCPKPVAVGAIAAQLNQSLPAISQKISALEEMGYVARVADPADRRVTCVTLTDSGEKKLREGRDHFEAKLNAALEAMGDARMQQLVSLLGELNAVLKQTVTPLSPKEEATKGE